MRFQKGDGKPENSGRQKGTPNKFTIKTIHEIAAKYSHDPVEGMVKLAAKLERKPKPTIAEMNLMNAANKGAAPYYHAQLKAIEHSGPGGGPIQTLTLDPAALQALSDDDIRQAIAIAEKLKGSVTPAIEP